MSNTTSTQVGFKPVILSWTTNTIYTGNHISYPTAYNGLGAVNEPFSIVRLDRGIEHNTVHIELSPAGPSPSSILYPLQIP
jgi:hypothetical protein